MRCFPSRRERAPAPGTLCPAAQRQMLAIARALMTDPKVLMLDEPTAGLAPSVVDEVFAELRRLAEAGVAVLMVEQNAKAALRVSDRGYVLTEGATASRAGRARCSTNRASAEAFLGGARRKQASCSGRRSPTASSPAPIIALGAIGVSFGLQILRFANFAHSELLTWGAYLALVVRRVRRARRADRARSRSAGSCSSPRSSPAVLTGLRRAGRRRARVPPAATPRRASAHHGVRGFGAALVMRNLVVCWSGGTDAHYYTRELQIAVEVLPGRSHAAGPDLHARPGPRCS